MAVWVVDFSNGGTKLERFLHKNQHTESKLLNFENWVNVEVSKTAKKVNFLCHIYQNLSASAHVLQTCRHSPANGSQQC